MRRSSASSSGVTRAGSRVLHAVHDAVPDRGERCDESALAFEPIDQRLHRRGVIGGDVAAARLPIAPRTDERQRGPGQADALDLAVQPPLERAADLVQREPDARRAAVDRQDAGPGAVMI